MLGNVDLLAISEPALHLLGSGGDSEHRSMPP
jgi:hypothetical protein